MTYPRLLTEGTAEERRLLNAARADRPSPATQAQVLATLGLAPCLAPLPGSTAPLGHAFNPFAQWIGIAGVVLGIGVGTALVANHFGRTTSTQRSVGIPRATPAGTAQVTKSPALLAVINPHETATRTVTETETATAAVAAALPLLPPKSATNRPQNALPAEETAGLEVKLIDAARQALQSGNPGISLTKLDERKRRVGTGMLEPEATLLRVQAKLALGQTTAAERDARHYLKQQPEGPIATRIRYALSHVDTAP